MSAPEKGFGIWHSGLTGRYYAGWAKRRKGTTPEQDMWEASGVKHATRFVCPQCTALLPGEHFSDCSPRRAPLRAPRTGSS